ncbi:MAG: hypothetical protein E6I87_11670 [Chloroflexi bacterium]|nr:MAG: hypothetical protein E6I87_11670 [Chloroflexota bacterium]
MDGDRLERAWAAGFFDGEGWAGTSGRGLFAQINQADPSGMATLAVKGAASAWESAPMGERTAWAAGLFDGEGWTGLFEYSSRPGYYSVELGITQSGRDEIPQVLRRIAELAGRGHFYGPYHGDPRHKPVHRWKTFGAENVSAVLHLLLPRLGKVKRDQARLALGTVFGQPALARGNPAWGAYKTHCVNGHEYATARVRPYRPRKAGAKQRRDSKQCLICSREQARARRQEGLVSPKPSSRSTRD